MVSLNKLLMRGGAKGAVWREMEKMNVHLDMSLIEFDVHVCSIWMRMDWSIY